MQQLFYRIIFIISLDEVTADTSVCLLVKKMFFFSAAYKKIK